jgi:hypothetical protein
MTSNELSFHLVFFTTNRILHLAFHVILYVQILTFSYNCLHYIGVIASEKFLGFMSVFFLHIFICILAIKGSIFFLQRYRGNENNFFLSISYPTLYLGPGMRNVL